MPRKTNTRMRKPAKVFVIVAEGSKTEPDYFKIFENNDYNVKINIVKKGTLSDPKKLLQIMEDEIRKDEYNGEYDGEYEAWIVCDKDDCKNEDLEAILKWSNEEKHYGVAFSCKKFELWLLLHFVDEKTAIQLLKKADFKVLGRTSKSSKGFDKNKIGPTEIKKAIAGARKLRKPKHGTSCLKECIKNHSKQGKCYCTDVYRLIERILKV